MARRSSFVNQKSEDFIPPGNLPATGGTPIVIAYTNVQHMTFLKCKDLLIDDDAQGSWLPGGGQYVERLGLPVDGHGMRPVEHTDVADSLRIKLPVKVGPPPSKDQVAIGS